MQCDWRFAEVKKLGSFLATSTTYVSFQRKGVLLAEEPPFCHSDAYHISYTTATACLSTTTTTTQGKGLTRRMEGGHTFLTNIQATIWMSLLSGNQIGENSPNVFLQFFCSNCLYNVHRLTLLVKQHWLFKVKV